MSFVLCFEGWLHSPLEMTLFSSSFQFWIAQAVSAVQTTLSWAFLQVPPLLRVLSIPLHCLIHIRKSPLLHRLSHRTRTVCASPTISPPLTISTLASAHSYLWVGFTYVETMSSPYIPCAVNFNYSRAKPAHMLYVVSTTASHAGKS